MGRDAIPEEATGEPSTSVPPPPPLRTNITLARSLQGPAQVIRLGHRCAPLIKSSDEVPFLAARPTPSIGSLRKLRPPLWPLLFYEEGLMFQIRLTPALSQANFRIAPLAFDLVERQPENAPRPSTRSRVLIALSVAMLFGIKAGLCHHVT